jgi:hypothetical protein
MVRLSSKFTAVSNLFFPFIIVPYLTLRLILMSVDFFNSARTADLALQTIFGAFFVFIFGFVSLKVLLPLKNVWLDGDFLIVTHLGRTERIPLKLISIVNGPDGTSLRRIEIEMASTTRFGSKIVFSPGFFHAESVAKTLRDKSERSDQYINGD